MKKIKGHEFVKADSVPYVCRLCNAIYSSYFIERKDVEALLFPCCPGAPSGVTIPIATMPSPEIIPPQVTPLVSKIKELEAGLLKACKEIAILRGPCHVANSWFDFFLERDKKKLASEPVEDEAQKEIKSLTARAETAEASLLRALTDLNYLRTAEKGKPDA